MISAAICPAFRRRFAAPLVVWALVAHLGWAQNSARPQLQPPATYFRNCTPTEFGTQECTQLEGFWAPKLAALGEKPLPDLADAGAASLYRFSVFGFVTQVPFATVRIIVHNDGSIDTIASRKWTDGRIESAQKHFSPTDAGSFLALLDWARLCSMNTRPFATNGPPPAKNKQPRVAYRDGGDYLLEGVHSGDYHVIRRRTFRELAPDDSSWEMLSGVERSLHQLNVWTSEAAQTRRQTVAAY